MGYVITGYVGMDNWHGNVGMGYVGMGHVSTGYVSIGYVVLEGLVARLQKNRDWTRLRLDRTGNSEDW